MILLTSRLGDESLWEQNTVFGTECVFKPFPVKSESVSSVEGENVSFPTGGNPK